MRKIIPLSIAVSLTLAACGQKAPQTEIAAEPENREVPDFWPVLDIAITKDPAVEEKVEALLATMTLEQKVAQMIQPEIRDVTVEDMRKYGFGSYLNGGGSFPNGDKQSSVQDWIDLADAMYMASIDDSMDGSTIPTMWGTDAVHGHNNVIGATLFPHNIGLGAANNPDLIEQIARVTAKEVMATGIDWVFAPTVATVRDDRWGRTYEGYSEDPEIVRDYSAAIVRGLQGGSDEEFLNDDHVISTVKHFVGDGGTEGGDDQGNNIASEQELFEIHAQGYVGGLTAGSQSVMASFNSWHGKKIHGSKYLLTDVLKDRMGFDGFVVGDWNGHGQVAGCTNESCPQAVNAGLDIYMVPTDAWKPLYENTIQQVKDGVIAQSRIDDAVRRILRVKFRAGLFDKPRPAERKLSGKLELIGAAEHREVARQAVRESLVLLKNKNGLLPLSPNANFLITGDGADNIGKQSGGWSITWQGTGNENADFPGGTSIYAGIKAQVEAAGGQVQLSENGAFEQKPDVAIVVFGEEPYAEGNGDLDNLEYQRGNKRDLELLKGLKAQGIPVVSVFITGRPLWVNAELNQSDAFVVAWLPGTEGQGVADVLLKDATGEIQHDFKGRLSFSWPINAMQATVNRGDTDETPLFAYGFGLSYQDTDTLGDDLSEQSDSGSGQLSDLVLFERAAKAPWRNVIGSSSDMTRIQSSVASNNAVSFRTMDRNVQEDTVQLTFNGSDMGYYALSDNFPNDLRGYAETDAALSIEWRVVEAPTDTTILGMRCESDCKAQLDITEQLKSASAGDWHGYSVDMACFANVGATFDKIFAPFVISTTGKLTIQIADVRVVPGTAATATLRCAD